MQSKYDDILRELEDSIKEIKDKHGISIEPLNNSIDNLKRHAENINKIEKDIDAIKEEITDEIKRELLQNKRAGKFSIFGFYVGAFGLIASIISLWFVIIPSFSSDKSATINDGDTLFVSKYDKSIEGRLSSIENNLDFITSEIIGINSNYKPTKNELLLKQFDNTVILKSDSTNISLEVWGVDEIKSDNDMIPICRLMIYINGKQLGAPGIKKYVKVINKRKLDSFGATNINVPTHLVTLIESKL